MRSFIIQGHTPFLFFEHEKQTFALNKKGIRRTRRVEGNWKSEKTQKSLNIKVKRTEEQNFDCLVMILDIKTTQMAVNK